ncbi:MAG TPA: hypothetical protein VGA56_16550, partial [Opitutaceae bacterium]
NDNWGGALAIDNTSAAVGAFPLFASSLDAALLGELSGPHTAHFIATSDGLGLLEVYDAELGGSARLVNFSARTHVGTGDAALVAGFVIAGTTSQTVLIRGVGPALASLFGIADALVDPKLEITNAAGKQFADSNDSLSGLSTIATLVGAFDVPAGGKDATLLLTLPPGAYTAVLTGADGEAGEALIEVYEVQ